MDVAENDEQNPSPPAEDSLATVAVGKTLFSRSFLYSTLLQWIADLQEKYGKPGEGNNPEVLELESDLEDSLCQLWDMTLEQDVVDMLVDNDVMSIIMQTLEVSNAPRLNEIALGILGNMLSVSPRLRNETVSGNVPLCERVLEALYTSDPPSIHEALRVLNCLYYDIETNLERMGSQGFLHVRCLINCLLESNDVPNLLAFLLSSSTNDDVLIQSLTFLAKIISLELDGTAPFADSFSLPNHMLSIIEGMSQLGVAKPDPTVSSQVWRAGVDGVSVLAVALLHKKESGAKSEVVAGADRVCEGLANVLHQTTLRVDMVENEDVVRMAACIEDVTAIAESGLISCPDLKLIVIRACALADALTSFSASTPESSASRKAEIMGLITVTKSLITKSLKKLPGEASAMATDEMTKLMKYLEIPSSVS